MTPRQSFVLKEALAFLSFVVLSVLMTWPLARTLTTSVSDPGDPYLNAWILEWNYWATFHQPLDLFHAKVLHPARYALAFSENMYGIALVMFPFYALGAEPLTVYNIAFLLAFAFSGYGAYVLGRTLTGSRPAGLIGGVFFAFVPFRFDHLSHIQLLWAGWLPLLLAAFILMARRPTWKRALGVGLCFVMNALSNIHFFLFGGVALGLSAIVVLILARERRAFLLRFSAVMIVSMLTLLPFLLPYHQASKLYNMKRGSGENLAGSATWMDWLSSASQNRLYADLGTYQREPERKLFPGLLSIALVASALLLARRSDLVRDETWLAAQGGPTLPSRRWTLRALDAAMLIAAIFVYLSLIGVDIEMTGLRVSANAERAVFWFVFFLVPRLILAYPTFGEPGRGGSLRSTVVTSRIPVEVWIVGLWVLIGLYGSLGLNGSFHTFLFKTVEVFRSIRTPARWAVIAYVGMSGMIAVGALPFLRVRDPRWKWAVTSVFVLAFTFELRPKPFTWYQSVTHRPPVYFWIKDAPITGAIVELPLTDDGPREVVYQLAATVHHKPLINGVSGFETDMHQKVVRLAAATPIAAEFLTELENMGASLVVVHVDELNDREMATRNWLMENLNSGRLVFLRRFDHGWRGDYVFAVRRNEPKAMALRAPEVPDPAGRTPRQNLELFLTENAPTYNSSAFGVIDTPTEGSEQLGRIRVSGWALHPKGVREVNILLQNRGLRFKADLIDRSDVAIPFPWYPRGREGFIKVFENRPDGVRYRTDLQVEVLDGGGGKTVFKTVPFHWKWQRLPPPVTRQGPASRKRNGG